MSHKGQNTSTGMTSGAVVTNGTSDDDTLDGGNGKDIMFGADGNDTMSGGNGNDMLNGDAGDDRLNGGIGHDILTGGDGADTFVFDANALKGGFDTVTDFVPTITTTTTTTDPTTGETTTTTTTTVNDVIELHNLLHGYDPVTSNLADFVQLTESHGDTILSVATNMTSHGAHFKEVAVLQGVTGLDLDTLLAAGNIVVS